MPKFVALDWVKNVFNVLISGWVGSVITSTITQKSRSGVNKTNAKPAFTQLSIPQYTAPFSTRKFSHFNLLNNLYTHNPHSLLLRHLNKI